MWILGGTATFGLGTLDMLDIFILWPKRWLSRSRLIWSWSHYVPQIFELYLMHHQASRGHTILFPIFLTLLWLWKFPTLTLSTVTVATGIPFHQTNYIDWHELYHPEKKEKRRELLMRLCFLSISSSRRRRSKWYMILILKVRFKKQKVNWKLVFIFICKCKNYLIRDAFPVPSSSLSLFLCFGVFTKTKTCDVNNVKEWEMRLLVLWLVNQIMAAGERFKCQCCLLFFFRNVFQGV